MTGTEPKLMVVEVYESDADGNRGGIARKFFSDDTNVVCVFLFRFDPWSGRGTGSLVAAVIIIKE